MTVATIAAVGLIGGALIVWGYMNEEKIAKWEKRELLPFLRQLPVEIKWQLGKLKHKTKKAIYKIIVAIENMPRIE